MPVLSLRAFVAYDRVKPTYFFNQPLHVSGIFAAYHQEVYRIYTTIGTCCAF
jgi:hypothetical protein